jgi:membrane protein
MTPLVTVMRTSLGDIFRVKSTRPFLLEILMDFAISVVFLMGLTAVAVAGIVLSLVEKKGHLRFPLGDFEGIAQFLFFTLVVVLLYRVFSGRCRVLHLVTGALVTSLLWFAMRPAFHLFFLYNPGYGFAFGSVKSLFVVIIWIYYSLTVFLAGAEIAASLGRAETTLIKELIEGGKNVPFRIIDKYVQYFAKGSVIFTEGEQGTEMYSVVRGRVAIMKGEKELFVIPAGKYFGVMSYLLSAPRVATAVALDDVELVVISHENINKLENQYPELVAGMLREMAERLRETNMLLD